MGLHHVPPLVHVTPMREDSREARMQPLNFSGKNGLLMKFLHALS